MRFNKLRLAEPIVRAVAAEGYTTPTPIQAQAIPEVFAGKDVLAATPPSMRAASDVAEWRRLGILKMQELPRLDRVAASIDKSNHARCLSCTMTVGHRERREP